MTLPTGLTSSITLTRYTAGSYIAGVWTPGSSSSVTITGMINAEKDQDIIMREGGGYADGVVKVYSNDPIYVHDKATGQPADRLTRGGNVYEAYEVNDPYSNLSVDHYRARFKRVDEKTNGA